MTKDEKQEVEVWSPTSPFDGTDLVPELRPGGSLMAEPPGGLVGRENTEGRDLILPSLDLLQGMSDPVTDGVEGAQPGKFYLKTSGEVLLAPLRLLIVHHSRSRALFPKSTNPRSAGLEVCLARDAMEGSVYGACDQCEHKKWGPKPKNEPPVCSESHNFVAMTDRGPAVLRLSKSSFKAARNFLTTWTMSSKNLWAHLCIVSVKKNTKALSDGSSATYFTMDMRWDQKEDVPPAFQENALEFYKQVQSAHEEGRFSTDDEGTEFGE